MRTSELGHNRTGLERAPGDSDALLHASEIVEPPMRKARTVERKTGMEAVDQTEADAIRASYFRDAEPLGSVPPPDTIRGVMKTGATMLRGERMQALMDKLGERLAFERSGTRLYEAFLRKCRFRSAECGALDLTIVEHFMREELAHVGLLREAIEQLGGDPTVQTPCADVVAVQSMGLVQSVVDPRTTVLQSLHALLAAELLDENGWDVLIKLMKEANQRDIAARFESALMEEQEHLRQVRAWFERMNLDEASLSGQAGQAGQAEPG